LNAQYKEINDLIDQNKITGFVKRGNHWSLKDLDPDFDESKYIPNLLSENKAVTMYELLAEVDKYSKYSDNFESNKPGKTISPAKLKHIYAALMSLGTNLGHHNMSRAARNITEKQLRDIEKNWLSPESIAKANEALVAFIQSLSLPTIFHNNKGELLTSSDGKKIVVAVNSLLANFSYKYYGKEQGISANSFIDEQQAFFHVNVLTSSDREAPYMLDGMIQSIQNIYPEGERPHFHATDNHGVTEAVYSGMHFINVSLAPRYKQIHKQTLYAFDAPTRDAMRGRPISPKSVINKARILNHWEKMLHLMASIKLGYCSASHVFKLLSMSEKSSELYRAMKEFGRLLKSSYILNYLKEPELRRNIQKQLNRVELGQKLSEAVFFGRNGKLKVGITDEIQKAMAAKTLLKNAIIVWNYLYLSDYCCKINSETEKQEVIDSIATGSVIAWSHINMHGIYDFNRTPLKSFKSTIAQMRALKI
jgi:TnpA family transposase